ncbi:hypothetical protein [Deinococcus sedimenti]|uniref:DUF3168 domain-containing protein n=1 Tax=Deinococcus sedimenti TaxID=1867090 RepID=A0ABQ2RZU0_9DEIO|nr:hypothetical protein [Deinococcus sedimenti]GGR84491.1 hypothetical protein GCM10008960_09420 [Deinococcus sedimenti]
MMPGLSDVLAKLSVLTRTLEPEQAAVPQNYAGAGARGIPGYLTSVGGQYIQLEEPEVVSTSGSISRVWITIACVASDRMASDALALLVQRTLSGTQARRGIYRPVKLDFARQTGPGVYVTRPIFEFIHIQE